ncbi:MAG TPA: hypothetical protein VGK40_07245 [Verrucomicrobiae bacterium]
MKLAGDKQQRLARAEILSKEWPRVVLGRAGSFLLGVVFMAWWQGERPAVSPLEVQARGAPAVQRHNHPANVGNAMHKPWGDFEYEELPLHGPNDLLPDTSRPLVGPRWYFSDGTREQITALLNSLDYSARDTAALLDPARWEPSGKGLYLSPPPELVLKMSPATRARLYRVLANYPENSAQRNPFRFRLDGFNEWFADSGLGSEPIEMLRGLVYTNGGTLCFCDGSIAQRLFSTSDFKRLVKTLYGENTFLMRLKVTPNSDIDTILKYWARGRQATTMQPLLEALAKVPGGGSVTIAYLLPPFARLRLYTYPNPATDPAATRENCFWTAMNFFNENPDPQFLNLENTRRVLEMDYLQTEKLPVYGDLIVLVDATGTPIHMCVYLADDVVFTKNGVDYMQPWVLMRIRDMKQFYVARTPVRMLVYRSKKS